MKYGLSKQQIALMRSDRLSDSFPVEFANGESFSAPLMSCRCCDHRIEDVLLRGAVSRPAAQVAMVDSGGCCERCDQFTIQSYRLYDDGPTTWFDGKIWQEYILDPPSLLQKLLSLLLVDEYQ